MDNVRNVLDANFMIRAIGSNYNGSGRAETCFGRSIITARSSDKVDEMVQPRLKVTDKTFGLLSRN